MARPHPPSNLSGVTAIAAGYYHTVALKQDGSVTAWGTNNYGQTDVPAGLTGVSAIAAGGSFTVAIAAPRAPVFVTQPESRTVRAGQAVGFTVVAAGVPLPTYQWFKDGAPISGATGSTLSLGLARTNHAGRYTVVVNNALNSIISSPPAVLTVNPITPGEVIAWGYNGYGATSVPSGLNGVVAIAAGERHTVALKQDGTVVAWGDNSNGQITVPAGLNGVVAIAAGEDHTVALKQDGTVVAWGGYFPATATVPPGLTGVIAISAGRLNSMALMQDGTVIAWGYYGGDGPALTNVTAIAVGDRYNLALRRDGTVVGWSPGAYTADPIMVNGVIGIAAGYRHQVALKSDGTVVAWGETPYSTVPAGITGVTAIAALYDTVALKQDGTVRSWPGNGGPVTRLGGVTAVAESRFHTVALATPSAPVFLSQPETHTVTIGQAAGFGASAPGFPLPTYQWFKDGLLIPGATGNTLSLGLALTNHSGSYTLVASNALGSVTSSPPAVLSVNPAISGQVVGWGNNNSNQISMPPGLTGVTAIAAGEYHTVALKQDGTVVTWGDNRFGQSAVPFGLSSVSAVAAGRVHTVALKKDGTVVAWGANSDGQTTVPAGLIGVTAIAAGHDHTVALKQDGTVVAWGWNYYGHP